MQGPLRRWGRKEMCILSLSHSITEFLVHPARLPQTLPAGPAPHPASSPTLPQGGGAARRLPVLGLNLHLICFQEPGVVISGR